MKHLKTKALVTVAVIAGTPAFAQNSSVDWSGFYVGGQLTSSTATYGINEDSNFPVYNSFISSVTRDVKNTAPGVHAGYNFQHNDFVVGIEGSISKTNLSDDFLGLNAVDTRGIIDTTVSMAARAKIGYSVGNTLLYVTAGRSNLKGTFGVLDENGLAPSANTMDSRTNLSLNGSQIGVGFSWMTSGDWSATVEYVKSDYGTFTTTGAAGLGGTETWTHSLEEKAVSIKFDKHF